MRIGLFGHYGTSNLGDEAIIMAAMSGLRSICPQAHFVGFSINPVDTLARHGIEAHPLRRQAMRSTGADASADAKPTSGDARGPTRAGRAASSAKEMLKRVPVIAPALRSFSRVLNWFGVLFAEVKFLLAAWRHVRSLDVVFFAGSGQFEDEWGGPWSFPYTLLKWTLVGKMAGKVVVFASVGANRINTTTGRWMIRHVVRMADYVSVRDRASARLLKAIGVEREIIVAPDLAHGLELPEVGGRPITKSVNATRHVMVNPMPIYDARYWHTSNQGRYENYVAELARGSERLRQRGYRVSFFATQPKDELVIRDLLEEAQEFSEPPSVRTPGSVSELLSFLAQADIVIAARFHGIVLAYRMGVPCVGVCVDPKQWDVMEEFGQLGYAMKFEEINAESLLMKVAALTERLDVEAIGIARKLAVARESLQQQYAAIGKLLGLSAQPNAASSSMMGSK